MGTIGFIRLKDALSLCCFCFLWCSASPFCCAQAALQVNRDGTASVTGKVEENYRGCARDGPCYFRLTSGRSVIHIIYDPGETDAPVPNRSVVPRLMKVERGTTIAAYGSHRQIGPLHTVDVYSRTTYYVHILSNGR